MKIPELSKLGKSALICTVALAALLAVKWLFPYFDWVQVETAILALVGAWLVNIVKEVTGL